jgi:phosphoribosylformylglycinamidine synthase subunit PurL
LISEEVRLGLTVDEVRKVRSLLGREPNEVEWAIIDAEWSEHSSYKSSRKLLRLFPTEGKRVVLGPGYDAGVVDVGNGYVVTLHIESHNHPSAVDPYGGSSTGIGGVIRDILSMGSRPIALVDVLRFGDPSDPHSRWLFRNVVRGIADYGNCVGVPTVAGDVEFDESFAQNCLVDVGCVGVALKEDLLLGEAKRPGDVVLMVGGSTGRDGVGGASFASKNLAKGRESERRSVQVPNPFMKKLLIDSLLEVVQTGVVRGMKDVGGGGLSTGLSEIASKGGTGVDVDLARVKVREKGMRPVEIVTSESQERMLLMLAPASTAKVTRILEKYEVPYAAIGRVTSDGFMRVRWNGETVANLPAKVVAEAPIIERRAVAPDRLPAGPTPQDPDAGASLLTLLSSPNISSRRWVYEQYDHEVGARTVAKPGSGDSALMRLPNGRMMAVKADGNSRHSGLDPRRGGAGCVAEACRNVVSLGAEPVAVLDHLQFGDPSDPEVYWAFRETVEGMADYCSGLGLPVVGGKVSFYNEDAGTKRAIKPSPVAMVAGLVPGRWSRVRGGFGPGESVFLVGVTSAELGGSEYHESVLRSHAGAVPAADAHEDSKTFKAMVKLVGDGAVEAVHDCSKGGLGVAVSEMCILGGTGADLDISGVGAGLTIAEALFSESHGRFVVSTKEPDTVASALRAARVPFTRLGEAGGSKLKLRLGTRVVASLGVGSMSRSYEGALPELMN